MTRFALILLLPFAFACGSDDSSGVSAAGDVSQIDSPSINRTGADCLVGSWEVDPESINMDGVNAMIDESGGGVTMEFGGATGRGVMTFGSDGSARNTMENLALTINADSQVGEMEVTTTLDGTSDATYEIDGDQLHFEPGEADLSSSARVVLGGREIRNSSMDLESFFETAERSLTTFECTGDVLLLDIHESADGGRMMFEDARYVRTN